MTYRLTFATHPAQEGHGDITARIHIKDTDPPGMIGDFNEMTPEGANFTESAVEGDVTFPSDSLNFKSNDGFLS